MFSINSIINSNQLSEAISWCNNNNCFLVFNGNRLYTIQDISSLPKLTEEELLNQAKQKRSEAVSNIIVEVDGMKFDGDEEAQTRMGRTIAAAIALGVDINTYTQTWVLADNTIVNPTIKQLAQALKLAGEEQTKLWTIPYETEDTSTLAKVGI